jgi:hypothetical protein
LQRTPNKLHTRHWIVNIKWEAFETSRGSRPCHSAIYFISIVFKDLVLATSFFGITTFKTPFSCLAEIFLLSTVSGSVKESPR